MKRATCGVLRALQSSSAASSRVSHRSRARCFGGILPVKWAIGMVNHSGMTLSVTSITYIEVKYTVA